MKGAVYYTAYSFSILGLCLLLLYSSLWELYWSESEPDCRLPESLSFMLTLGFPLLLIPPFLLDWRIACIYATTYDWRGRRVSPLVVRDRGTKWLLIRYLRRGLSTVCLLEGALSWQTGRAACVRGVPLASAGASIWESGPLHCRNWHPSVSYGMVVLCCTRNAVPPRRSRLSRAWAPQIHTTRL